MNASGDDLAVARQELAGGDLSGAEQRVRQALSARPRDPEALLLLAEIALAAGQIEDTLQLTEAVLAARSKIAAALALRGRALWRRGDLLDACAALRGAIDAAPTLGELRWTHAKILVELDRPADARASALEGLRLEPQSQSGRALIAAILRREFHAGLRAAPPSSGAPRSPDTPVRISVVICSITPGKFQRVAANYAQRLAGISHEIILIDDARSLCEGYNRGFARATGDILVFSHDDIEILSEDFAARLLAHLEEFDLVGVAGTTRVVDATWGMAGWPHVHGQVVHADRSLGTYTVSLFKVDGAVVPDVQGLDGLFFAAGRRVFDRLRFDEATFDGFHLYDLDFTFSAFLAGFRLAVCNDIVIAHDSRGRFGADFNHYAQRFLTKHLNHLSLQRGSIESVPEVPFLLAADALAFCRLYAACLGGKPLAVLPAGADLRAADRIGRYQPNRHLAEYAHGTPRKTLAVGIDGQGLAAALRSRLPQTAVDVAAMAAQNIQWPRRDPEARYQLIAIEGVLERVVDSAAFLRKLHDFSVINTQLVLGVMNERCLVRLAGLADDRCEYDEEYPPDSRPPQGFTLSALRRALSRTGWRVTRVGVVIAPELKTMFEGRNREAREITASFGRMKLTGLRLGEFNELCSSYFLVAAEPGRLPD